MKRDNSGLSRLAWLLPREKRDNSGLSRLAWLLPREKRDNSGLSRLASEMSRLGAPLQRVTLVVAGTVAFTSRRVPLR